MLHQKVHQIHYSGVWKPQLHLSVADFYPQIVRFLSFVSQQIVPFHPQIVPFLSFVSQQIDPFYLPREVMYVE